MPKEVSRIHSRGWKAEPTLYPPPPWRVVNRDRFLIGSVLSRAPEEESPTGLASWHSRWLALCRLEADPSTFLRSLRSRPITALLRYYGRSDSCLPGSSSASGRMNTVSRHRQVSLIHVPGLPIIPSPTTRCTPGTALSRYPSARRASHTYGSGLHLSLAGSPAAPGRIEFVILRTDRPPPAALHLASWRRSCSRFTGRRAYTWRGLSPLWSSTLSGALGATGGRPMGPPLLAEVGLSLQEKCSPGRCFLRAQPLTPGHNPSTPEISRSLNRLAEPGITQKGMIRKKSIVPSFFYRH